MHTLSNFSVSAPVKNRTLLEYRAVMDNAPVAIAFSQNRILTGYNRKFEELFGFEGENGIGQATLTLYPSQAAFETASEKAFPLLSAGKPFISEMEFRRQDSTTFWGDAVAYLVDPRHPPEGTIWIITDITAKKHAEDHLKETLLELEAIFTNASVGIAYTRNKTFQRSNDRLAELFGYTKEEMEGLPAIAVYPSVQAYETLGQEAGPQLIRGEAYQTQIQYRRKNGDLIWCKVYAKAFSANQPGRGTIWIIEDIEEVHRTQEKLLSTLYELESITHNATLGILITRNKKLIRYNPRFAEIFGIEGDEGVGIAGRTLYRSDEEYEALGKIAYPLLSASQPLHTELYMRRLDGQDIWVKMTAYLINPKDPAEGTVWLLEDRSEYRQAEEALKRAYAEQELILDHSVVGIAFLKDRIIQRCNHRLAQIYGYEKAELIGQSTKILYQSEAVWKQTGIDFYTAFSKQEMYSKEILSQRKNGDLFWVKITGQILNPQAPHEGSIWNFEDITEQRIAEEVRQEKEALQKAILDSANYLLLSLDPSGKIISCNPASYELLGYTPEEMISQGSLNALFIDQNHLYPALAWLRSHEYEPHPLLTKARTGQSEEHEWLMRHADGHTFPASVSVSLLKTDAGEERGFLLIASNITHRKEAEAELIRSHNELKERVETRTAELQAEAAERQRVEQKLLHQALHDSLTGLPNRTRLHQRIEEVISEVMLKQQYACLIFIDLDRFKTINDTLGHQIGDQLLRKVAHKLRHSVKSIDTVARIGGDEFVILIGGLEAPAEALPIANRIHAEFAQPLTIEHHQLYITPSIGIAIYPQDGDSAMTLMRNADTAMYQAKAAGRNIIQTFNPEMNAEAEQYFQIETSLRQAIEREEFILYYQPIVDCKTGELASMEALIRWQHPVLGLVPPIRFIPIAEECGLITPIGNWVLKTACRQIKTWKDAGYLTVPVAINLSGHQFRDLDFSENIEQLICSEGLFATDLELEITETILMSDVERTLTILRKLHDLGISLSVDDFGTGYSSLAYLKRFPVDKLKIDRAFVKDATENSNDRAIVEAILSLARSLQLNVVAEGVETESHRQLLNQLACPLAQGYLFSRPIPASEFEQRYLKKSGLINEKCK